MDDDRLKRIEEKLDILRKDDRLKRIEESLEVVDHKIDGYHLNCIKSNAVVKSRVSKLETNQKWAFGIFSFILSAVGAGIALLVSYVQGK